MQSNDTELMLFRQMFQGKVITKPRRDEREWKTERRLMRRSVARLRFGGYAYRKEFKKTIYK